MPQEIMFYELSPLHVLQRTSFYGTSKNCLFAIKCMLEFLVNRESLAAIELARLLLTIITHIFSIVQACFTQYKFFLQANLTVMNTKPLSF